jgi:protein MpaA
MQVIGYSVQRRPIELHCFGAGDRPVLVMATIHGDETGAATIGQALVNELQRNSNAGGGVPIAVIPIANPDGYAARTRVNANHVDLNRNFPAGNWSTRGRSSRSNNFGGASAASEPETLALMQTIQAIKPRLIISIHSMEKPCNNYDGPAKAIADIMSRYNSFPATANIGYPTPGSLGNWAGVDQQIPVVTLEMPHKAVDEKIWVANRDAITAAIDMMK